MTWLDDLAGQWMPDDPVTLDDGMKAWLQSKYDVVAKVRPSSIVEIGVRAGYSAYAMLSAAPTARYLGIDSGTGSHGGHPGALIHARRLLEPFGAHIVLQDSQAVDTLPVAADLLHVDGDHSYEGCMHDMGLALTSGVRWLLVDDTEHIQAVKQAVPDWLAGVAFESVEWIHDGHRGSALIQLPC